MPWSGKYLSDEKIISIVNEGETTWKDYEEQTIRAQELSKKYNTHLFLLDDTKLENKATVSEIYNLPSLYDKLGAQRRSKLAVIFPRTANNKQDYEFYANVCANRGWNVKLFHGREDAIEWLKTKS